MFNSLLLVIVIAFALIIVFFRVVAVSTAVINTEKDLKPRVTVDRVGSVSSG